jgi:hypothetical protein
MGCCRSMGFGFSIWYTYSCLFHDYRLLNFQPRFSPVQPFVFYSLFSVSNSIEFETNFVMSIR